VIKKQYLQNKLYPIPAQRLWRNQLALQPNRWIINEHEMDNSFVSLQVIAKYQEHI